MAVARAAAAETGITLYKYLQKTFRLPESTKLPKPMIVMIEGGKHAADSTDLQEYLVAAMGNKSAAENVRMEMEIYEELKKILKRTEPVTISPVMASITAMNSAFSTTSSASFRRGRRGGGSGHRREGGARSARRPRSVDGSRQPTGPRGHQPPT